MERPEQPTNSNNVAAAPVPAPAPAPAAPAPAPAPAAYPTPAQILATAQAVGVGKAGLPFLRMLVLAMFAGMFIAFGGMFFTLFAGDPSLPFSAQRLLGGLFFALGLLLVLCCGAELFTGNNLMACALAGGKITWKALLRNWGVVYLGNLLGSLLAVAIVFLANYQAMNGGLVGDAAVSIAASKASLAWGTAFFKGIACNILVCLAVWMGFAGKTVTDKFFAALFPVAAFVACGFEHCVANMYFLPMGMLCQAAGYGANVTSALTWAGVFSNLTAATLGNIVGGAVIVGLAYWLAFREAQKKA